MSSIKMSPNASGTGIFTVAAPATNTDRTLTLPDQTGTILSNAGPFTANASASNGAVTIDASNNVGIGTSSIPADCKVAVSGVGLVLQDASGAIQRFNKTLGTDTAWVSNRSYSWHDGNGLALSTQTADPLRFGTNGAERARIDSSGNLLVGTTSVAGSAVATFVKTATAANQRVLHLTNTGASGSNSPAGLNIQYTNASSGNGSTYIECYDSNSTRFLVLGSGNVQNANNSYGGISDAKLKENVTDATPKLGKLNQVRVVNYNLIGETQKQIGVIAQELEQIFPGMVEEMPDRDAEGNDLGTTTKSVKYSVFVPMLIKAMQEQQALIESLTARIAALEAA